MTWTASTVDGSLTWDGEITGTRQVVDKVVAWLDGRGRPVEAFSLCPEFPASPDNEYAVLIALLTLYGGPGVDAHDAPWQTIIPDIPEGAVS